MSTKTTAPETTSNQTVENADEDMASKLKAAGKKAEAAKATRRARVVKGSHLLETLTKKATEAGLNVEDKSGFFKVTGSTKGRTVYIAKKGGRVDFSGFSVPGGEAVLQLTEQEARERHLGKVRGQLNFEAPDADVLAAFDQALVELNVGAPAAEEKAEA